MPTPRVANTPAVAAMTGLPYAAGSLGGILVIKIWMTLAVALGFAAIFLVTRNGRADEEAGRTELLRSSALGRHAYSMANYVVAGGLSVLVGLLVSLLCLSVKLPAAGSWVMGASIAGTGAGLCGRCGALRAAEFHQPGRQLPGRAVLALFYFIRAGADLQSNGTEVEPPELVLPHWLGAEHAPLWAGHVVAAAGAACPGCCGLRPGPAH